MRDADWSRETLLRCDWLPPSVAPITTVIIRSTGSLGNVEFKKADEELPVVKETCLKRRCMSPHITNMSE